MLQAPWPLHKPGGQSFLLKGRLSDDRYWLATSISNLNGCGHGDITQAMAPGVAMGPREGAFAMVQELLLPPQGLLHLLLCPCPHCCLHFTGCSRDAVEQQLWGQQGFPKGRSWSN